jgi:hypothetical protein
MFGIAYELPEEQVHIQTTLKKEFSFGTPNLTKECVRSEKRDFSTFFASIALKARIAGERE